MKKLLSRFLIGTILLGCASCFAGMEEVFQGGAYGTEMESMVNACIDDMTCGAGDPGVDLMNLASLARALSTAIDARRDAAENPTIQELKAQREREAEKERMDHELAKLKSELERLKIEKEIADLKRQRVLEKKSIR